MKCFWTILTIGLFGAGACEGDIIAPEPPARGAKVVRKYLNQEFLGIANASEVAITHPHRVYFTDIKSLADGRFLSEATPRNWRYLLSEGTNTIGAASVTVSKIGLVKFVSLQKFNRANEMLEALNVAYGSTRLGHKEYELRSVEVVPPVGFRAVWLHNDADDILIPLEPTFGRYEALREYSENELLPILQESARRAATSNRLLRDEQQPDADSKSKKIRPETDSLLRQYHSDRVVSRNSAFRKLRQSADVSLFTRLASDLFLEEETMPRIVGEHFLEYPASVRAAEIMQAVIMNSDEFSRPVRAWASELTTREPDALRTSVRMWFLENQDRIKLEQFRRTVPPSTNVGK